MHELLEKYLWDNFGTDARRQEPFACDIINQMKNSGMISNEKQAYATLKKWDKKGWVSFGTSISCCWKEKKD